jgi:hypothetical protein
MKSFKQFINEGNKYPMWVKVVTAGIAFKVRNLAVRIAAEKSPIKQNVLIAQQNKLIAYMSGLSVAVSTSDQALMNKIHGLK